MIDVIKIHWDKPNEKECSLARIHIKQYSNLYSELEQLKALIKTHIF